MSELCASKGRKPAGEEPITIMQEEILRFFEENKRSEGYTSAEVAEALSVPDKKSEIRAILSKLKKQKKLAGEGSKNFHILVRPDKIAGGKTLAGTLLAERLERYKHDHPGNYPPGANEFLEWYQGTAPMEAGTLNRWIGIAGQSVIHAEHPDTGRMVLLPKSDAGELAKPVLEQHGVPYLEMLREEDLDNYPPNATAFEKELKSELKRRGLDKAVTEKQLKTLVAECGGWKVVKASRGKKVCLPKDEILARPIPEQELKRILIEWMAFKEGGGAPAPASGTKTVAPTPEPVATPTPKVPDALETRGATDGGLERLFLETHERLDREGSGDRAVPIPQLWRELRGRMDRQAFERLLDDLANRRAIQLERRSTMDGVGPAEREDCYRSGDKLFYYARRLT